MFYTYIIYSKIKNQYYTGLTNNIDRRLTEHNSKTSSTVATKTASDYVLIFCQTADTRTEARSLEKFLKSGSGREFRSEIVKYHQSNNTDA